MNKEQSIKQAADHANQVHEDWTNQAFEKSKLAIMSMKNRNISEFQICDLRHSIDTFLTPLPHPPTNRAWGAVSRLLRQAKLIETVGYKPTNNLTAHNAIAAIYKPL